MVTVLEISDIEDQKVKSEFESERESTHTHNIHIYIYINITFEYIRLNVHYTAGRLPSKETTKRQIETRFTLSPSRQSA
jgi:hypothetical protein